MKGGNLINVGSAERPIFVPGKALKPETPKGRAWWDKVATGSVVLNPEKLDKLLEVADTDGKKS